MSGTKPFTISRDLVKQAFQLVKENRGAAGVDKQTLADFDFLGYTFCGRLVKKKAENIFFVSFSPAVSKRALKSMRAKTRESNLRNRTDMSLDEIAERYNPVLQGWINYYGCYNRSSLYPMLRHFNKTLVMWAMRKYKKLRGHKTRASQFIQGISERQPNLFAHWKIGMVSTFA